MDIQSRRLGVLPIPSEAGPGGFVRQGAVQEPCMRVVDGAFESLQPIALLPHLRQMTVILRHLRPFKFGQRRKLFRTAHVGPDHSPHLRGWIRLQSNRVFEIRLLRFVRHIQAAAFRVVLPSMINAAQATLFVAAQEERGSPKRAEFIDHPHSPLRVAIGPQFLPEQLDANGWTIGLRQFPGERGGHPVSAHRLAHRSTGSGSGDQLIFFGAQHRFSFFSQAFSFAYGAGFQPWTLSSALILWTNENLNTLSAETDSFMPRDLRVSSITRLWIPSLMLPSATIPGRAAS